MALHKLPSTFIRTEISSELF